MNANLPASTGIHPTSALPLIVEIDSPLDPEVKSYEQVEPGISVAEHLKRYDLTTQPRLVMYNTEPLLEKDWEDTYLNHGDQLTLVAEPGFLDILVYVAIGISVLVAGYSLYTILTADTPDPGDRGDSPNYSVGYRGNRRRPGAPMPVLYGEMKVFPDLGGQFSTYHSNEQWLYQIFDITLGEVEPLTEADVYYEDTPLTNFDEYYFEHVQPGQPSEIFPNNVHISSEVNNLEILNPTPTIAYVVNPPGTQVTQISWDLAYPQGLYHVDDKGRRKGRNERIYVQWREIDDAGDPVGDGSWSEKEKRIGSGAHKYPYRWTMRKSVSPGRYEARVRRTRTKSTKLNDSQQFDWVGLRGFSPSSDTTETTRVAIAIRASKRLGNASLSQFSILAKRRVPIWNGSSWSLPSHTRLAAWAFADVCRADYGAKLADEYVDLDTLLTLAGTGVEFNGIYDNKNTVWSALNDIARPFNGRAIQRAGGIYSIKRDLENQPATMMFTMRNIIKDSFAVHHNLPITEATNFVRATFKNKLEDYRETSVDCVPAGVTAQDPYEIQLRGVTDEQSAYDIGIRMALESRYRRRKIAFKTGLEGLVVEYMDTILVAHYMLGLEQTVPCISGEIKSDTGYQTLEVWEDLTPLLSEVNPKVYLMDTDGSPYGPVSCTLPDDHTIVLDTPAPSGIFLYSDTHAGPRFAVGRADDFMTECKVIKMQQSGEHQITIECVEDNQTVYTNDPPPGYTPIEPPADTTPRVSDLQAAIYGTTDSALYVTLTWTGENADYYIVDMSEDSGLTYEDVGRVTESTISFNIPLIDPLYLRVRGVNLLIGPPAVVIINPVTRIYTFPSVFNLRPLYPFNGPKLGVQWDQLGEDEYARLKFIHNSTVVKEIIVDDSVSFAEITDDEVLAVLGTSYLGHPFPAAGTRYATVRMHGLQLDENDEWLEDSLYQELTLTNDPMGDLQNLTYEVDYTTLNIDFQWPEPHSGHVFVHASLTPGFTPDSSNLIHLGDSNTFGIVNQLVHPGTGNPNTYYIRIAGCDSWGPDNLSYLPEFSIQTTDKWPPITEDMLDSTLGDRIDKIDRDPAVPGGLIGLVDVNITNITNNRTDIDLLLSHFVADVLQVEHGGTGVTTATGTGSTVRSDSPALTGTPTAPTQALADNSTAIATTAWVQSQGYETDPQLGDLPTRVGVLESYFTNDVLEIAHGGTASTTATGSGETVLATSPHLTTPTADTPLQAENSTRIATTAWVKLQGYSADPLLSDLPDRVDALESHFGGADPWILEVVHGGTGVTTSTGTGSVVLSSSPTVDLATGSTAVTQLSSDNSTAIATTAWVKGQGYATDTDLTALEARVTTNEGDISNLQGRMTTAESDISNLQGRMTTAESDISTIEGYFVAGVLQVIHGGTGVTDSTGTGKTVLSNSPTFTGNPIAPTPLDSDNDTSIATTAFVKNQDYATNTTVSALDTRVGTAETNITNNDTDISNLQTDVGTLESYFTLGVLQVIHGGTGVTVSTGSGEVVLSNSPDLDGNPTSTTVATSDNSTKIATTAFVKNQDYATNTSLSALDTRVGTAETNISSNDTDISNLQSDVSALEGYFVDGVLQVLHGGTGVSDKTGSGTRVVLQNSPTVYLGSGSTMPTRALGDNTTRVANTAFVQQEIADQAYDDSGLQSQINTNKSDLDVIEGYFTAGVLDVLHGGTGVTTSTGSGSVVLSNSPTLGYAYATKPSSTSNSTRLATTSWVRDHVIAEAFDDSGLQSQIDTNRIDLDVIESHFSGGVLEVVHGGTGVTTKTGTGSVVLNSSPGLTGSPTAPKPSASSDTTHIATTSWVRDHVIAEAFDDTALWNQVNTNTSDLDVIEGYFVGGVLQVLHGGTGVTASTGSGTKFVLQSSPDLQGNPTAPTQATSNSSTRLANTAFVHNVLNEQTQSFPKYAQQGSFSMTTSWKYFLNEMLIYPSATDSIFRAEFCFHYYPGSYWNRARLYWNGAYNREYLMSREWDGGRWTVEGQSKVYYLVADGTLNAQSLRLRGVTDGSSYSGEVTITVEEIVQGYVP